MGARLRVVSYNIHSSRDDLVALACVVRRLAPDVLIVQEGPRRFRWRAKCAALARSFGMVHGAGGLPALGNVIMTNLRVRVVRTWHQRYPLTPGRHMRGAAFAELEVDGYRVTVVGAHLSTDDRERPSQARLLRAGIGAAGGPVIVGADVNDVPGSPVWDLVHDGLVDVGQAAGAGEVCTYPSTGPNRRIDTLAVTTDIGIDAYRVETGSLTSVASDHFPVLAELSR